MIKIFRLINFRPKNRKQLILSRDFHTILILLSLPIDPNKIHKKNSINKKTRTSTKISFYSILSQTYITPNYCEAFCGLRPQVVGQADGTPCQRNAVRKGTLANSQLFFLKIVSPPPFLNISPLDGHRHNQENLPCKLKPMEYAPK